VSLTCLIPTAAHETINLGQLFFCIGEMLFGDITLAGIFFMVVLGYMMWKLNVPWQGSVPMAVLILFALGSSAYGISEAFTKLFWLILIAVAVIVTMGLLAWARR
jgi:hypothetical protein